jgi:uncharacterized protein
VAAVRGNNDRGAWADAIPARRTLRIDTVRVLVLHDVNELRAAAPRGVAVVVSGHSHTPLVREDHGVLYVNPGSAGPRRFKLPISIGFLDISRGVARARLATLAG